MSKIYVLLWKNVRDRWFKILDIPTTCSEIVLFKENFNRGLRRENNTIENKSEKDLDKTVSKPAVNDAEKLALADTQEEE